MLQTNDIFCPQRTPPSPSTVPAAFRRVVQALLAATLLWTGCEDTKTDEAPAKKPPTVDCKAMCTRTFGPCVVEVLAASGKVSAKQIALLKKTGRLERYQAKGFDSCLKRCTQQRHGAKAAKAVRRCLRLKDCQTYAACMKDRFI